MAKNKGSFEFGANLQVKKADALDPRVVWDSVGDLLDINNWPSDNGVPYTYEGLQVAIKSSTISRDVNSVDDYTPGADYDIYVLVDKERFDKILKKTLVILGGVRDLSMAGWKCIVGSEAQKFWEIINQDDSHILVLK